MKEILQDPNGQNADANLSRNVDLFGSSEKHLVQYSGQDIKVHPQIIQSLIDLTDKSNNAGFDLRIASAFRSFERQLLIWNNKATGLRPVLDQWGNAIDINSLDDEAKVFAILQWSALPGASRHHWGTDIDIYDASRIQKDYQLQLTLEETENNGPFAEFHQWLTQELQQGSDFYRPYIPGVGSISPEPWHLSYAPLARIFATQLSENILREKIQATDILLKDAILKNINEIFNNYIKPYQ
ncbi:MAG: D-alanyl-D-alanine carboxypeptidase family protein [Gammaproteobacteria bacterium]|nr:MAG: D-alanyl-D-alanine carboxypeptidase family protein [Gammaproteobacteria bacterium]